MSILDDPASFSLDQILRSRIDINSININTRFFRHPRETETRLVLALVLITVTLGQHSVALIRKARLLMHLVQHREVAMYLSKATLRRLL